MGVSDGLAGVVDSDDEEEDEKFESPWTHFQGLGLEPSVPSYLRVTGKVQNQCFSKKETEMHLNDVWIAKEAYEEEAMEELRGKQGDVDIDRVEGIDTSGVTPGKIHLKDFFSIYLEVQSLRIIYALEKIISGYFLFSKNSRLRRELWNSPTTSLIRSRSTTSTQTAGCF